jgi:hypothetical protein
MEGKLKVQGNEDLVTKMSLSLEIKLRFCNTRRGGVKMMKFCKKNLGGEFENGRYCTTELKCKIGCANEYENRF